MCGRKRTNGGRWPGKRRPKGCTAEVEYTRRVCRGRRTREEEKLYGRVGFVFPLVPSWTRPRLLHVGTRQRRCNRRERVLLALHRTQRHGCPRRPARVRLVHLADTVTSRHPRAKRAWINQAGFLCVSAEYTSMMDTGLYSISGDVGMWSVFGLRSSVFGLRGDREIERDRTRPREDGDRSPNLAQSDGYPYSRLHMRGRRLPLSPRPLFILQINPHLAPATRDRSACARERGSAKSSFRAGGTSASFRTQLDRRPSQGIFSTFIHDTCRIGPSRVTYATSELPG